ncbi:FAD-NAD(P)-binding pyridine nucleotide-disulfide oxidoreductase [Novymonas esmeraldas]|uniref:L-ornithine N(5)-monooxygenase [NAD(P)H] n=1 Tax=Novymonas esmeraldas TaxID=1808958 RepID=A0AAW0ENF4_9TRYP
MGNTISGLSSSSSTPAPIAGGGAAGLAALEALYQRDLVLLNLPVKRWTPVRTTSDGAPVADVLIIGAGMAGICLAIALKHLGVPARLVDSAPAGYEGPWDTTARMETLRSMKHLVGPALGFAHLTFQAWFTAQWGTAAWAELGKIPRVQWMEYLRWLKRVNELEVENDTCVRRVQPSADGVATVEVQRGHSADAATEVIYARHVVLATGRGGLGGAWLPRWAEDVPAERRAHSSDVWSGESLKGLRVAVIGGGSSAMDCAGTALEGGAAEVHLLIRRHSLPLVNKSKASVGPGNTHGYPDFSDAWKWQLRHYIHVHIPPPHASTLRVSRHANAFFHFDAPVERASVRDGDGRVRLDTPKGPIAVDFVIFATGFATNWEQRPEFAPFAAHVLQWQDVYTPPASQENTDMSLAPYLGPHFEFREKVAGACPGLDHIHCFCYPATLSYGAISGDIPQISDGARMLAQGLAGSLCKEDLAEHFKVIQQYEEPELDGDEWTAATWPPYTE